MELNRLGNGALGNAFAKLYGLDDINAVPTLAPEIMPTSSIWERPEFWALLNGKLAADEAQIGAVAAQFSYHYLSNPVNSGVMIIVEWVAVSVAAVCGVNINARSGTGGVAADTRTQQAGGAAGMTAGIAGLVLSENNVSGSHINQVFLPAAGRYPVTFILGPGGVFGIQSNAQNVAMQSSIEWRERPLGAAEVRTF